MVACILFFAPSLVQTAHTWNGSGGEWDDAVRWTPVTIPAGTTAINDGTAMNFSSGGTGRTAIRTTVSGTGAPGNTEPTADDRNLTDGLGAHIVAGESHPGSISVSVADHYTKAPIDSAYVYLLHDGIVLDSAYTNTSGRAELMLTATSAPPEIGVPVLFSLGANYPNPFQDETRVDLTLPVQQVLAAEVYNVLGQRVSARDIDLDAGFHTLTIALGHLPPGVYFLRMSGTEVQTVKLLKTGHSGQHGGEVAIRSGRGTPSASLSKTGESGYTIRAEKHRYTPLEVMFDPADGAPPELLMVRNNEISFEAKDAGGAGVSVLLAITNDEYSETVTTPGTLVLESGRYRVVAGPEDDRALDTTFDVVSRDTTFSFTLTVHSSTANVSGTVYTEHGDPAQGAAVTAYRAEQQIAGTTVSADGRYAIVVPADGIDNIISIVVDGNSNVPSFFDPGTYRGVSVAARVLIPEAGANYGMNFVLRTEQPLTRPGGADIPADTITMSTAGGTVMISKIPADLGIVGGSARAYSPTFMPDAFPGEFATRQEGYESGLFSGGFASINLLQDNGGGTARPIRELRDTDGNPVWVEIRFRLDREDWHVIQDGRDVNHLPGYIDRPDRIDVPLYYYDEAKGDWLLNASFGWLEDDRGLIPPSALAAIRDGSYERDIYVTGLVDHFTFYNLDYPKRDACFIGRLADQDSQPVVHKQVVFRSMPGGLQTSFFSNEIKAITDANGNFQIRVPRTERGPGDDWNNNDKVDNFRVIGSYEDATLCSVASFDNGGNGYLTPDFPEEDGCGNLGTLTVELKQAKKVTFELTFLDEGEEGEPNYPLFVSPPSFEIPNAARATFQDPRVPLMGDVWKCACDDGNAISACNIGSSTDASGTAEITIPVLDVDALGPLDLIAFLPGQIAYHKQRPDLGIGAYEFANCSFAVPENKKKETIRCEVELRGPPEVTIVQPVPTGVVDGNPVYSFLFDEIITLEASGEDIRGETIDPLDLFVWANITRTGPTIAQSRSVQRTAAAAFGTGQNRSILVDGYDFYGWSGEATLTGVDVAEVELTVAPDTLRLVPGISGSLTAHVTGAVDTTATWASSSLGVATVNAAGLVSAISPGTAVITARSRADATKTATTVVEVANLTAAFSVSPATGDSTTMFTFDADASTGDIIAYTWDFGDGNTGAGKVATHTYGTTGSFSVTLVVTGSDGTTANTTKSVSTAPGPTAVLTATPVRGNPPLIVFFDAGSSTGNIVSWSWDFGDGQTGAGDTLTHVYADPGLFMATLSVEDADGLSSTDSTQIRVNQAPVASFTVSLGPGELDITVNAVASEDPDGQIVNYNWDFGDGTVIENGNVVENHQYAASAAYEVTLVVEDDDGATDTTTQIVDFDCTIIEGDVDVINQAELAALAGVCEVTGSLRIENIHSGSLGPLHGLLRVGGDLQIRTNPGITSLLGLSRLGQIDGRLQVRDNASLASLAGLTNLTVISENVRISDNDALEDVSSLVNLVSVAGEFRLSDNPLLSQCLVGDLIDRLRLADVIAGEIRTTGNDNSQVVNGNVTVSSAADLNALAGMCEVTGHLIISNTPVSSLAPLQDLRRTAHLEISNNASLTTLTGLNNLYSTGRLYIYRNSSLNDLTGLASLTILREGLMVRENTSLSSLAGLDNLALPGNIDILDNPGLTDMTGLEILTEVNGQLAISGNSGLTSLHGLNNLATLGGQLRIAGNSGLTSLTGLENLTSTDQNVVIENNAALTSLSALSNLNSVTWNVSVHGNESLTSLHGLGGIANLQGGFSIQDNAVLPDLSGLENLVEVGRLDVVRNSALTTLSGLEGLARVNGTVLINQNDALSSLSGLENLAEVEDLHIGSNPVLENLSGLDNLQQVTGQLRIAQNPALTNLSGLGGLHGELQALTIEVNPLLASLAGLEGVTAVGGVLIVSANDVLPGLTGLEGMTRVGSLRVQSNSAMTSFSGLDNLNTLGGTGQHIWITGNSALTSIASLSGISIISGLTITNNPVLGSLAGLEGLSVVEGSLQVESLAAVSDLHALANLTRVDGSMFVRQNASLTSLGMNALARIGSNMNVSNHASLPQCEAEALRDQVLARDGIGGLITLTANNGTAACE